MERWNKPKQLETNHLKQEKLDYLHNNPVDSEIVGNPEYYLYSSAMDYAGKKGLLNIELINWRSTDCKSVLAGWVLHRNP